MREDSAFLNAAAQEQAGFVRKAGEDRLIAAGALLNLPSAISSRLIYMALYEIGAGFRDVTAAHIAAIMALCRGDSPSAEVSLPRGVVVRRVYGDLLFTHSLNLSTAFFPTPLAEEGETVIPGIPFRIFSSVVKMQDGNFQSGNTFWLKYDIISEPLQVRPRAPGDQISLLHRACSKSLKKLLIDEKIPRHLRDLLPVIADKRGVAAVAGFGPDKAFAATPGDLALKIVIEGINTHASQRH